MWGSLYRNPVCLAAQKELSLALWSKSRTGIVGIWCWSPHLVAHMLFRFFERTGSLQFRSVLVKKASLFEHCLGSLGVFCCPTIGAVKRCTENSQEPVNLLLDALFFSWYYCRFVHVIVCASCFSSAFSSLRIEYFQRSPSTLTSGLLSFRACLVHDLVWTMSGNLESKSRKELKELCNQFGIRTAGVKVSYSATSSSLYSVCTTCYSCN